jgi:hypothetical protein
MFQDISNFYKATDYLPILNGALVVDLFVLLLLNQDFIQSSALTQWYKKFHLGAFGADVLSLVIVVLIARYVYTYLGWDWSIYSFLFVIVLVQLCHDLLFSIIFYAFPRGVSPILDVFKDYANESGAYILIVDALMMIGTVLIGSLFAKKTLNTNIVLLILLSYLTPYFVFSV